MMGSIFVELWNRLSRVYLQARYLSRVRPGIVVESADIFPAVC